jgi:hypothetical protein
MNSLVLSQGYGLSTPILSNMQECRKNPYPEWEPSAKLLKELYEMGGCLYRTHMGYRVTIPEEAWRDYREKPYQITAEKLHNLKQLAWIYLNQFDPDALFKAIQGTVFFDELKGDIELFAKLSRGAIAHFVHIIVTTGTYEHINNWINEDLWYDPKPITLITPIPLDYHSEDSDLPSLMDASDIDSSDGMDLDNQEERLATILLSGKFNSFRRKLRRTPPCRASELKKEAEDFGSHQAYNTNSHAWCALNATCKN